MQNQMEQYNQFQRVSSIYRNILRILKKMQIPLRDLTRNGNIDKQILKSGMEIFNFEKEDIQSVSQWTTQLINLFGQQLSVDLLDAIMYQNNIFLDNFRCQIDYKPRILSPEIRDMFHKSKGIIENINTINVEGMLKCENIKEIFVWLNYKDKKDEAKRQQFIEYILNGKNSISVKDFFHKIEIDPKGDRSPIIQIQPQQINPDYKYFLSKEDKNNPQIEEIMNCLKSKQIYTDEETPNSKKGRAFVHLAKEDIQYCLFSKAEQQFDESQRDNLKHFLSPNDIAQGSVASCYFLSAIIAMTVKYPQLLYRLFIVYKNPAHIYGVRLFIDGKWQIILLDTCFPINKDRRYCGAQQKNAKIWPMLLEKAFAKIVRSYDNIKDGLGQQGIRMLTGAPSIYMQTNKYWIQNNTLQQMIIQGCILTCTTNEEKQVSEGLVKKHSYSILQVKKMGYKGQITLIQLRTPWDFGGCTSKLVQKSEQWQKKLLIQKLREDVDSKNGTFWMLQQDFFDNFSQVNICRIKRYNTNSFLDLNLNNGLFSQINITISKQGKYAFTIYLQNRRNINRDRPNRQRYSWMFLFKKQGGMLERISSNSSHQLNNTLQLQSKQLQQGKYMLALCALWLYQKEEQQHQKQEYCLTSYGPNQVLMESSKEQFNDQCLSDYIHIDIQNFKVKKIIAQPIGNKNILKKLLYYGEFGYILMSIENKQQQKQEITIKYQKEELAYVKILPPHNSEVIELKKQQQITIKFIVPHNCNPKLITLQTKSV